MSFNLADEISHIMKLEIYQLKNQDMSLKCALFANANEF